MATALSPMDRLEAGFLRGAAALPPRAQRVLGGPRRVTIDGQVLDPEVQLLLRLLRLSRRPTYETLPVPEAREEIRREAAAVSGPPLPVARVAEQTLPGPGGDLGARLYVPFDASTPGPLLVYLHGGGWVLCDLDTHDQTCRFIAREAGVRVLAVDYRLAPEHPFPAAARRCRGGGALRDRGGRAAGGRSCPGRGRGRQRGRQPCRRRGPPAVKGRGYGAGVSAADLSGHRPVAQAALVPALP